jgi:RimJ/RimL family protein N-acetyltransferase
MQPVHLESERLLLRPFRDTDVPHLIEGWHDSEVRRWTFVPEGDLEDQAFRFVTRVCPRGWESRTNLIFAVELRGSANFVGAVGIFGLSWVGLSEQLAWVGYWGSPGHRRQGYIAEALQQVCHWAFRHLGVDRLEAVIEVGNVSSIACARRAGFTLEGRHRARTVQDGYRRDAWVASLLAEDVGVIPRHAYKAPPVSKRAQD